MRWFVEISPLGTKSGETNTLCVEAPQWSPALQKARSIRGDNGALSNFSIELLDDGGYRAIDPVTRTRYVVRRAPDDAALSEGGRLSQAPPPVSSKLGEAARPSEAPKPSEKRPLAQTVAFSSPGAAEIKEEPASEPKKRPPAHTMAFASTGAAVIDEKPAESTKPPEPVKVEPTKPAEKPAANGVPSFTVIGSREDNPTDSSPLTYREYAYAVAQGTSEADAHRLIMDRYEHVRATIESARLGKLINLAVFDHVFQGKPQRRPLVTLAWKDWKTDPPDVRYPQRDDGPLSASKPPPASMPPKSAPAPAKVEPVKAEPVKVEPAPAKVEPVKAEPVKVEPVKAEPVKAEPVKAEPVKVEPVKVEPVKVEAAKVEPVKAEPAKIEPAKIVAVDPATIEPAKVKAEPAKAEPAPASKPPESGAKSKPPSQQQPARKAAAAPSKPPPPKKRLAGDDLLTEMFEASGDLHFARDAMEGAEFVLQLVMEKLPSEVAVASLFDMNKRDFVIVRQVGGPRAALMARQPERAPLAGQAMRKRHAILVEGAEEAGRAMDDRWRAIGVELKSLIVAPVELSGRTLGLIEIANPVDGAPYNEGDSNALTYLGQQLAEFVAAHGVIVDEEHVRGEPKPAPPPPPPPSKTGKSGQFPAQSGAGAKKR